MKNKLLINMLTVCKWATSQFSTWRGAPHHRGRFSEPAILVLLSCGLGDLIESTHVLRSIREHYRGREVVGFLSCNLTELAECYGFFDEIIPNNVAATTGLRKLWVILRSIIRLRRRVFDVVVNFCYPPTWLNLLVNSIILCKRSVGFDWYGSAALYDVAIEPNLVENLEKQNTRILAPLGISENPGKPYYVVSVEDREQANKTLSELGIEKKSYIVVHPFSELRVGSIRKGWDEEKWGKCLQRIFRQGDLEIVIVGSKNDTSPANRLLGFLEDRKFHNLVGLVNLRTLAGIIEGSNLVLCTDSLVYHMSVGIGVPTVCILGPSDINYVGHQTPNVINVSVAVDCKGCLERREKICRKSGVIGKQPCLDNISLSDVSTSIEKLLRLSQSWISEV